MNTIQTFTMSLHQATNVLNTLQKLANAVMPARLSFIVARNLAALSMNPEVVAAEQERTKLVRQYGKPTDDGFAVPPERHAAFQSAFAEIGSNMAEVRLQVFPKDAVEHFPPISPADVLVLEQFIEQEEVA